MMTLCGYEEAFVLLRSVGGMALDCHLFLIYIENLNQTGLMTYFRSMLNAWKVFKFPRGPSYVQGWWLLCNPAIDVDLLESMPLRKMQWNAGITNVGHLLNEDEWLLEETLVSKINIKSVRLVQKLLNKVKDLYFYTSFLEFSAAVGAGNRRKFASF